MPSSKDAVAPAVPVPAETVAFTVRLDGTLVAMLDTMREEMEKELGFSVSRSDAIARICKLYFAKRPR